MSKNDSCLRRWDLGFRASVAYSVYSPSMIPTGALRFGAKMHSYTCKRPTEVGERDVGVLWFRVSGVSGVSGV